MRIYLSNISYQYYLREILQIVDPASQLHEWSATDSISLVHYEEDEFHWSTISRMIAGGSEGRPRLLLYPPRSSEIAVIIE